MDGHEEKVSGAFPGEDAAWAIRRIAMRRAEAEKVHVTLGLGWGIGVVLDESKYLLGVKILLVGGAVAFTFVMQPRSRSTIHTTKAAHNIMNVSFHSLIIDAVHSVTTQELRPVGQMVDRMYVQLQIDGSWYHWDGLEMRFMMKTADTTKAR